MADESCKFGDEQLDKCVDATAVVDNIIEIENYLMPDSVVDSLNASANTARANATKETIMRLDDCQKALSGFINRSDITNYDLIENLKVLATEIIVSDEYAVGELRKMEQNNLLQLVKCDVADRFETIANQFVENSTQLYRYAKLQLVDNMTEINAEVDALGAVLSADPNKFVKRIEALTATLKGATEMVENREKNINQNFTNIIREVVNATQNQFNDLFEEIASLTPRGDALTNNKQQHWQTTNDETTNDEITNDETTKDETTNDAFPQTMNDETANDSFPQTINDETERSQI